MLLFYDFYGFCACPAFTSSYLIDSGFLILDLLAGGCPAATHFSLLRRRKVSKRKATRLSGSLRCASGNLRYAAKTGVGANSLHCVTLKQRAALIPLLRRSTGPDRTGQSGNEIQTAEQPNSHRARVLALNATNSIARYAGGTCANGTFYAQIRVPVSASAPASPVLAGPVLGEESRIRAARCLSEASLRGPRLSSSSTGCLKRSARPQAAGRLFFGDFLLAKQKKVTCRRATPGQQVQAAKTQAQIKTRPTQRRQATGQQP
ncbi:hypothetical protein BH10PSE16_BH10PSE16_07270 [soil metagenome]